jgi:1,4-dihydroxy-2-naphthoyl-CoA synthase
MKIEDFEDILYEKEENGICTITICMRRKKTVFVQSR